MNFPFVIVTGNLQEFSAEVVLLKDLTIMEKPIKQKDLQELLNNTLKIPSGKIVSKISSEEIELFITQKLQSVSSLMLEIITKSKPDIKILKKIPKDTFFGGYFYVGHLLTFENEKFSIVFNFDLGISKNIAEALAKEKVSNPEVILECLGKVALSMMKKITENSSYSNVILPSKVLFLLGNGESKNIFGTLQDNFLANIVAKNDRGSLVIHVIKV